MEENMNTTEQTTQAENMENEAPAQKTQEKQGKLFTQDEVNAFVKSQVSRMMKKATRDHEAEYSSRMAELQARETKLYLREQLQARGMAKELADIIDGADEDEINRKLDTINKVYGSKTAEKEDEPTGFVQIGYHGGDNTWHDRPAVDLMRRAMGLE